MTEGGDVKITDELGEPTYVRYSKLPACGKSYNFRDKCYLEGVGVWRALLATRQEAKGSQESLN